MRLATLVVAALALASCTAPAQLPVAISACRASVTAGVVLEHATVRNDATKPVHALRIHSEFYRNFRFTRFESSLQFSHELDPGASAPATVVLGRAPLDAEGAPQRCFVTHVDYLDGTHDDLQPN